MLEHRDYTLLLAILYQESQRMIKQINDEKDELYRSHLHERRKRVLLLEAKINRLIDKAMED